LRRASARNFIEATTLAQLASKRSLHSFGVPSRIGRWQRTITATLPAS